METSDKKPRRDKRRCVHFVGIGEGLSEDHCSIIDGERYWLGKCVGSHGCMCYEDRKWKGEKNGWR